MPLTDLKPRSGAALVRNLLDAIEGALSMGASRRAVWEKLREENSLNLDFPAFCVALKRARKTKRHRTVTGPSLPAVTQQAPGPEAESEVQPAPEPTPPPTSSGGVFEVRDAL